MFTSMKLKLFAAMPLILALTACGSAPAPTSNGTPTLYGVEGMDLPAHPQKPAVIPSPSAPPVATFDDPSTIMTYICYALPGQTKGTTLQIGDVLPTGNSGPPEGKYVVTSDGPYAGASGTVSDQGNKVFTSGPLQKINAYIEVTDMDQYRLTVGNNAAVCDETDTIK